MAKNDEGKVIAIISYITWIGWIIAFIMNMEKKNDFAKFHLRQSLLLMLIWIVGWIVFWIPIIGWLLALVIFIFWIMGLVYAVQGQKKKIPLFGEWAQDWFKFI